MKNWKTKNRYEIVQVLSGRTNIYLILKDSQLILIDTGKESLYSKLINNLDSLGFSVNQITYVILTHTHFDHCQLASEIKDNSSCVMIVSYHAENWIKTGYTELPRGTTLLTSTISRLDRFGHGKEIKREVLKKQNDKNARKHNNAYYSLGFQ